MILAALFLAAAPAAASTAITSLGRDIVIAQPVNGRVVAVLSNVRIDVPVNGDVIVWGGNVSFGASGEVQGNLSVFLGDARAPEGRNLPVRGTVSTPGTLLSFYLSEMERAPWRASARPATLTGLRLMVLALWLVVALALLYTLGSPFARAAAHAESDWFGAVAGGILGVLAFFLAAAAALALLPSSLSVPIALFVGAVLVAAKVFGMGALFLLIGQRLTRKVTPAARPSALAVGFSLLGALSLLPIVGELIWIGASFVAVGIAFTSRFGTPRFRVSV